MTDKTELSGKIAVEIIEKPLLLAVPQGIVTNEFIAACVAPDVRVEILTEALAAASSAPAKRPAP
jgi:hypothetical protein